MVFINDLQRKTLLLVDSLINEGKTFNEIWWALQEEGYLFEGERRNGYDIKTRFYLKDSQGNPSFVWLKKRRNGLAYWETIKLT
jgi:hypothetical protein